ncbi:MAG TPA: hypothetical protein EYQ83_09445, partial [Acidobacteria bacterium]|nr:hypothetical protein [Acidobacteriota bacterium]
MPSAQASTRSRNKRSSTPVPPSARGGTFARPQVTARTSAARGCFTAMGMTFSEAGPVPAQGNVAQQMFWYTAFTADTVKPGLP